MTPSNAGHRAVHGGHADTEPPSQVSARHSTRRVTGSTLSHDVVGQPCASMAGTSGCVPVAVPVRCVLGRSAPREVNESVVMPAAWPVQGLLSLGAGVGERFEHQAVNQQRLGLFTRAAQSYLQVPRACLGLLEHAATYEATASHVVKRPHAATVGHLVEVPAHDGQPTFIHTTTTGIHKLTGCSPEQADQLAVNVWTATHDTAVKRS